MTVLVRSASQRIVFHPARLSHDLLVLERKVARDLVTFVNTMNRVLVVHDRRRHELRHGGSKGSRV